MTDKELEEVQYKELCEEVKWPKVIDKKYFNKIYGPKDKDKENENEKESPVKYFWGLCGQDLRNIDMSHLSLEDFKRFSFDENTIFSFQQKLKFNPDKLLEEGKVFSEDIKDLHAAGIDGTGVKIAIIDRIPDCSHRDLKDKIRFFKRFYEGEAPSFNHGLPVTSLIADNQCGVAPNVSLYLFSTDFLKEEKEKIFKYILENNMKFDLISMSSFIDREPNFQQLKSQLISSGNQILDSFRFFENFVMGIKEKYMKPEANLLEMHKNRDSYPEYYKKALETIPTNVVVPCAGRTYLQLNGGYMYDGNNSASYSIPQVAGSYALAKQLRGNLTYDEFAKIAKETAHKTSDGFYNINLKGIVREIEKINFQNKDKDAENLEIYNNSKEYFLRLDDIEKNKNVKTLDFSVNLNKDCSKLNSTEKSYDDLIL